MGTCRAKGGVKRLLVAGERWRACWWLVGELGKIIGVVGLGEALPVVPKSASQDLPDPELPHGEHPRIVVGVAHQGGGQVESPAPGPHPGVPFHC